MKWLKRVICFFQGHPWMATWRVDDLPLLATGNFKLQCRRCDEGVNFIIVSSLEGPPSVKWEIIR